MASYNDNDTILTLILVFTMLLAMIVIEIHYGITHYLCLCILAWLLHLYYKLFLIAQSVNYNYI